MQDSDRGDWRKTGRNLGLERLTLRKKAKVNKLQEAFWAFGGFKRTVNFKLFRCLIKN